MSESIKEFFEALRKSRLWVFALVMALIYGILLSRMFHLQVIMGEQYQNDYTYSIVKERTLNSSRGNIYDRNGKLLAYNELAYTITIEDNGSYDSTKNKNKQLNAM
ncbi:MAG: peptidoglycan glycosyltransferase, partial [Lachnospiraceae bacterium]|nr:peptidoglycan glycosyltransferase [Lachnospiraceae bacterium]